MAASERSTRRLPSWLWRGASPILFPSGRRNGTTLQLFLLVVLPLTVLLFGVTYGSLTLHNQAMRSLVGDRDLRAVRAAASTLNQAFFHQKSSAEMLAEAVSSGQPLDQIVQTHPDALASFDRGVALFDRGGNALAASPRAAGWVKNAVGVNSLVRQARAGAQFSAVFPGDEQHPYIAYITAPTSGGDVLVAAYSPDQVVQTSLRDLLAGGQVTAWVVTPQQQVIYQLGSLPHEETPLSHPGTAEALNGESGINYDPTSEGEHVVAFSPIPSVGWALVLEEPWESMAGPLLQTTQAAPLLLIPVVLLMLLALWFGLHQIVQPLKELEGRAAMLADGDFASIQQPVGGVPEIQNLQTRLGEMAQKLEAAQESLHSYIGAITAGVENERRSLARELHDDTLQALIALNQRIQLASLHLANAQDQASLDEVGRLVQETMVNLRRLVRGLRPIYLEDLGLVASLEMLANETGQNPGLDVQMSVSGSECRLAPDVEMALYRIVQEALSNVVRHAQASHAWLEISFSPQRLALSIRDNGQGFVPPSSPADFARRGHYGLLGLYERAELIDAELHISSSPGKGTSVQIFLDPTPCQTA